MGCGHVKSQGGLRCARIPTDGLTLNSAGRGGKCSEPEMCLGRLLPRKTVGEALECHGVVFRERLYTPE